MNSAILSKLCIVNITNKSYKSIKRWLRDFSGNFVMEYKKSGINAKMQSLIKKLLFFLKSVFM